MNERVYSSIKEELRSAIFEYIEENQLDEYSEEDVAEARESVTNATHYIIGYWNCEKWLESHELSAWEAIEFVRDWEVDECGYFTRKVNSEQIANMIAWIIALDVEPKTI